MHHNGHRVAGIPSLTAQHTGPGARSALLRRLQVVALLDTYHVAGTWTDIDRRDAMAVIREGLGSTYAAWALDLLSNVLSSRPTDAEWPAFRYSLQDALRGALDAAGTAPGDREPRGSRGGRPPGAQRRGAAFIDTPREH